MSILPKHAAPKMKNKTALEPFTKAKIFAKLSAIKNRGAFRKNKNLGKI